MSESEKEKRDDIGSCGSIDGGFTVVIDEKRVEAFMQAGDFSSSSELHRFESIAGKIEEIVKLAGAFPPNLKQLRIVEIPGIDIQADGGTHVKNTKEIGRIEVIKLENKGKNNRRIYFKLI